MTSLASQLQSLQTTQTDLYDQQKKSVSILVSSSEAKRISLDAYYKIGKEGFRALSTVNSCFEEFSDFFNEQSRTVQRAILSVEENKRLDEQLDLFFIYLGPNIEREAALKSLEWLVQRYLVHEMNIDSFISCILPYFESQLFIRILQVINLSRSKTWEWLKPIQKSGRPLTKRNLFRHWSSNEWFRNFVANTFMKQMKTISASNLQIYAVFFILTVNGGLNSLTKISETHLSTVVRTMEDCLYSDCLPARGGMCFLLLSLTTMTTLADSFITKILENICNNNQLKGPMATHMTACAVSIVHVQNMNHLPDSINALLLNNETFFNEIVTISKTKNMGRFVSAFVSSAVRYLFNGQISGDDIPQKYNTIVQFLEVVTLPTVDAKHILKLFVTSTQERISQFRTLKSCPNFGEILNQLDIYQPECLPHEAASELLLDPIKKKDYLARNNNFDVEADNMEDARKQRTRRKQLKKEEIKNSIRVISENVFLKANQFHLAREQEYEKNFQEIVNVLHVAIENLKKNNCTLYNKINKELFSKSLKNFYKKMYFLSMIWSSSINSVKNLDSSLKEWALMTATGILNTSPQETISWIMSSKETFIPTLFLPLCEGKPISPFAFDFIASMVRLMGPKNGHNTSDSYLSLLKSILLYREEITQDANFLPQAIENICKETSDHLSLFKDVISDEVVPMRIKSSLLYAVSKLVNFKTLLAFVPLANEILDKLKLSKGELSHDLSMCLYYILIRIRDCQVNKIYTSEVNMLVLRCIKLPDQIININGKYFAPQELVFNKDFILRTSQHDAFFLSVLTAVIDLTDNVEDATIASNFHKLLTDSCVSGHVLLNLLGIVKIPHKVSSLKESRAKRKKVNHSSVYLDLKPWQKLQFMIELIGTFRHVKESWIIVKPLFDYLELSLQELSLSSVSFYTEIFHQRILTIIHQLLEMTEKDLSSKEIHERVKINISLLVQLMRSTENPDTRRRVLMILSLSTKHFPDEIMHNIISIFLFMGTTLIKMDDSYSIDVIHETMDTILPPLIESTKSNPEDLINKLFQILKVFVVALPDIPVHRRLPMHLQLAHNIGSEHLWLLMAATAETHVFQSSIFQSKKETSFHFGKLSPLWENLFRYFPVLDRLNIIKQVVQFLVDIPHDKDSLMTGTLSLQLRILNKNIYTSQKLHLLKYTCVQMLSAFLNSSQLAKEISKITDEESELEFSQVCHDILDIIIPYLQKISLKCNLLQKNMTEAEVKYWPKLHQRLTELIKMMFELMPPNLLIKVILNLVWSNDLTVRYRALEIVSEKLHPRSNFFNEEHTEDASKFIKFLIESGCSSDTPDNARQMSMFTLHSVLKLFGNNIEIELVQSVLQSAGKILKKKKDHSNIKLQTVLVAVEGIIILEDDAFVSFNDIISFILTNLQAAISQETVKIDSSLQILTTSLQRITEVLPHLLGEHLSTVIYILCGLFYNFQYSKCSDLVNCVQLIKSQVLAIEPKILLDKMKTAYFSMVYENLELLPIFFQHLSKMVSEQELDGIFSNLRALQKFFSLALQIRTTVGCPDNIDEIENAFFKSVSDFLMRCDEDQCIQNFKYIKKKCTKYAELPVTLTFYKLCSYLASSINVVFISLHLVDEIYDDAISLLTNNNTDSSEEMFTDDNWKLVDAVLDTLKNVFAHDSIGYMNRGRLSTCMTPIINQIDNTMGGSDVYKNRLSNHLKPCIALMSTVCKEDDVWRDLNQLVLSRIKNDWKDTKIILGSLEIFEAVVDEAGVGFVQSQLSDIMVYIAEAMEITDHHVQLKAKLIFSKLEEILGESLKSHLGN